jgi:N-acetylneuraminate synthase
VLNALAASFRGLTYFAEGTIVAVQDRPKNVSKVFSPANVIQEVDDGGEVTEPPFLYEGSARKARKTVALVSWNDPADNYKEKIEFQVEEYDAIALYCASKGIVWSASAWDLPSLIFLDQYRLPFNKIASALSTNLEFVSQVASRGVLTYASVGMCDYSDIDNLVRIFDKQQCPLVLMHTISTYPAKDSDLNLKMIGTLHDRYNLPVGYSGHEPSVSPSIVAASLGAVAIERHITLDRTMWGTDHSASLEPSGLNQLVGSIRKVPVVLGDGLKKNILEEEVMAKKMRYWL